MAGITKREQINRKIAAAVTKMTPEKIAKLKQSFAIDATIEEACFYAEIHTSTYHRWINKHPELSDEFDRLRHRPVLIARQTVVRAIEVDSRLAMEYLSRKRASEFQPQSKVEHAGKVQTEEVGEGMQNNADVKKAIDDFHKTIKDAIARSHGKKV